MNGSPSVVVNKGGFLSAVAKGLFGTIMVVVVCGTVLGLYGMRMFDRHLEGAVEHVTSLIPEVVEAVGDWQKALPPQIADALNDRRALDYRDALRIQTSSKLEPDKRGRDGEHGLVMVEITNTGQETVSLLTLRLLVEDESTNCVEASIPAAMPIQIGDWRGPLLPGQTRRIPQHVFAVVGEPKVTVELTDLRVWKGPAESATQVPAVAEKSE